MFSLVVGLSIKGGIVAALPVFVYNVYGVARPILSKQQRRTVLFFLWLSLCVYLAGTAYAYFVLLPIGLGFLLQFGADIATPLIRISEYMELAMAMLFWLGLVFELPVVMLLLAKLRVVSHQRFSRLRGHFAIAALILGMVITPTVDLVNQTLVAVPIMVLYEVGLFGAWLAEGGHKVLARRINAVSIWLLRRPVVALRAACRCTKRAYRKALAVIGKLRSGRRAK